MKSILFPSDFYSRISKYCYSLLFVVLFFVTITPGYACVPSSLNLTVSNTVTTLSWSSACTPINSQIQILRLYNTLPFYQTTPSTVQTVVDWSEALTIETNNSATSIELSLREGTGYYLIRIREVLGALEDGNFDSWSLHYSDGFLLTLPVDVPSFGAFYYTQLDDDKNWIYHREFVEGEDNYGSLTRIGENITYANNLLMPIQEQKRTNKNKLISTIVPDYSGRASLKSLPAAFEYGQGTAIDSRGLKYETVNNVSGVPFKVSDYDKSINAAQPRGLKLGYYSDNNTLSNQVPSADTFGYSRTLYYSDGLGRPKLIASPGKEFSLLGSSTPTHAIKKFYGKADETELIRLFGDYAPASSSVDKEYTVDPNGVHHVTYTNEHGNVIATCLSAPQSNLLDELPIEPLTVTDIIREKFEAPPGPSLVATFSKTFAIPTTLKYVYQILPNVYADSCLNLCATCDYTAILTGREREDTAAINMFKQTLNVYPSISTSLSCVPVQHDMLGNTFTINSSSTLQGTYDFSLFLMLNNENSVTHKKYIDSVVDKMHQLLSASISATGALNVIGGNPSATLSQVQTYIGQTDINGLLAYLDADTTLDTFRVVVGDCDTITLPTGHCEKYDCTNPAFSEYMKEYLFDYNPSYYVTFNPAGTNSNISVTTDSMAYLFYVNTDAEFNQVIENMVADGFDCDSLWNIWKQVVRSYAVGQMAVDAHAGITTFGPTSHKMDWWTEFMNKAGWRHTITVYPHPDLHNSSSPTRTHPHKSFAYSFGEKPLIEDAFCHSYRILIGNMSAVCTCGSPGCTPPWYTALKNLPTYTYLDSANHDHVYNFYQAIKDGGEFTDIASTTGVFNLADADPANIPQLMKKMELECYKACNSRKDALVDNIINLGRVQAPGRVEAFAPGYPLWSPGDQTMLDFVLVERIAEAAVEVCKVGCIVDSATQVPRINVDNMVKYPHSANQEEFKKSMVYDMEILDVNWDNSSVPGSTPNTGAPNSHVWDVPPPGDTRGCIPDGEVRSAIQTLYDNTYNPESGMMFVKIRSRMETLLYYLNRQVKYRYDSLRSAGYGGDFEWTPPVIHNTFPTAGLGDPNGICNVPVNLNTSDPYIEYTWGRPWITSASMAPTYGVTLVREFLDSIMVESTYEMKLKAILTQPLAAHEYLVFTEQIPLIRSLHDQPGFTMPAVVRATMGSLSPTVSPTTMRYEVRGPKNAGDTIRFSYFFETPRSSLNLYPNMPYNPGSSIDLSNRRDEYSIDYHSTVSKHTTLGTAMGICSLVHTDRYLGDTISLYLQRGELIGTTPVYSVSLLCAGMDALIPWLAQAPYVTAADFQYERNFCYRWVKPFSDPPPGDTVHIVTCGDIMTDAFANALDQELQDVHDKHENKLRLDYKTKCMDPEAIKDLFATEYSLQQYNYTLYYYDRSGNLMKTVSPKGVKQTGMNRLAPVNHDFVTQKIYNIRGQVEREITPDGQGTTYYYDTSGRLRLTQNAHQLMDYPKPSYSYYKYDYLNRLIETGDLDVQPTSSASYTDLVHLEDPTFPTPASDRVLRNIVQTVYDQPYTGSTIEYYWLPAQNNLRNRVSYVVSDKDGDFSTTDDEAYTVYSYDVHGNVEILCKWVGGMKYSTYQQYKYDLVSGKVITLGYFSNSVSGLSALDDFAQTYSYDDQKRLSSVKLHGYVAVGSTEKVADYEYYPHGPLKRTVLSSPDHPDALQGIDYTYTLHGWLKAINSAIKDTTGNATTVLQDPGQDDANTGIGQDAFAEVLNYYKGDFRRTGSPFTSATMGSDPAPSWYLANGNLYDGNIISTQDRINDEPGTTGLTYPDGAGTTYRYDQRGWLRSSKFYSLYVGPGTSGQLRLYNNDDGYNERFTYDDNGNIDTLVRWANSSGTAVMTDSLHYRYPDVSGVKVNRLASVTDLQGNVLLTDVEGYNGFTYDPAGRLIWDSTAKLRVYWRNDHKVDKIVKVQSDYVTVISEWQYLYDGAGNRVRTTELDLDGNIIGHAFSVYDATDANLLATYSKTGLPAPDERYVYGSDRILKLNRQNDTRGPRPVFPTRSYELKDHLGNVRVVMGQKLVGSNGDAPDIENHFNYYAYGSLQPERHYNSLQYQSAFNGQRKQDYLKNVGDHNTAEFWEYDTRLGKRWNIDPVDQISVSNYATFGNNPILWSDHLGNSPSTDVKANGDGTYKVVGGKLNDDRSIYILDDNGNTTGVLGRSVTPYSFYYSDAPKGESVWRGTIDPSDKSGVEFLNNNIIEKGLGVLDYAGNAKGGEKYDFKRLDRMGFPYTEAEFNYDDVDYHYRGMPLNGLTGTNLEPNLFGSARDVGNFAAGYIAGRHHLTWEASRLGFEALQKYQQRNLFADEEGLSSQMAQFAGWKFGRTMFQKAYDRSLKNVRQSQANRSIPFGPK